jgi:SagB-type dehydrogenase family enzyme
MKRRRSDRDFSPDLPLSLAALSEFLYRVARVEGVVDAEPQELMTRPYPAGGSIHELEFYLAIERCDGLEPGFYHYDGHRHGLRLLRHGDEAASPFVTRSASAMGLADRRPQMVVLISTRLPRLAWKYEGMAYRASLLNVGVVFQTMYLVATDMGLACCANGTGSIADFAEKTGLDVFEETAIGEVAIGVRE